MNNLDLINMIRLCNNKSISWQINYSHLESIPLLRSRTQDVDINLNYN